MERDFMGLNFKDAVVLVKEEGFKGCKEPGVVFSKSSAVQWPMSNGFEGFNNRHLGETRKSIGDGRSSGTHFSGAPVQLTIFYRGMVNVYEDISPEKAQAIMLFAGTGARAQAQVATPRNPSGGSQPMNTTLLSPVSVGPSMAMNAPKGLSSLGQVMQSAVPQSRKSSLARFLEKRKERVMASAPYNHGKSSLDSTGKPGSSGILGEDDMQ